MERLANNRQHEDGDSDTVRLLRAYHLGGDTGARDRLVELYLPLVESFARQHARAAEDYDDVYQAGCIGLIHAIDRFEIARGEQFEAFAVPNIAGEMRRHVRDRSSTVRLPRRVVELRRPARAAYDDLAARLGRAPTAAEVARDVGADESDVALALDGNRAAIAVELPSDGTPSAGRSDRTMATAHDRLLLSDAFRRLDERERQAVYLRYVGDLEPGEIARRLGVSPRQLSRMTRAALAKLRDDLDQATEPGEEAQSGDGTARRGRQASKGDGAKRSGRLLLRLPQSLHSELAHAAERQAMSLNGFITECLGSRAGRLADDAGAREGTSLRSAIHANAVALLLLVVACTVALFVAAVRGVW